MAKFALRSEGRDGRPVYFGGTFMLDGGRLVFHLFEAARSDG